MTRVYLDVDTRRLKYRYQPQNDPVLAAQQAAFRAQASAPDEPKKTEKEDATIGNEETIRGIPAVGHVAGVIEGTRPGDPVKWLDADARFLRRRLVR